MCWFCWLAAWLAWLDGQLASGSDPPVSTVTHAGTATWTTTAGNKTLTATPALGDLIVVIAPATGVATSGVTDNNSDGLGTYTKIGSSFTGFSTTGDLSVWVRNALVGSASSTVFTAAQSGSTGGGLDVYRVSGMTRTGAGAVRSSGGQSSGSASTTPAPVLNNAPLAANAVITAVCNGTNPGGVTGPAGYTAPTNLGYNSPAAGMCTAFISSGVTGATVTWGGTSASAFASVALELDTSVPVALVNSPVVQPPKPAPPRQQPQAITGPPPADPPGVSVVQVKDKANYGSTATISFTSNVAIGNSVLVWICDYNTSGSVISTSTPQYNGSPVTGALKLFEVQN